MARFSKELLQAIRDRLALADVVSRYVSLTPDSQGRLKAYCPFHQEKTASFKIDTETQRYKCFGCDAKGDIFSFLQQMEHRSFPEAVEVLADWAGVTLPQDASTRFPQDNSFSAWYEYHGQGGEIAFLCGRKRDKKKGFRYCKPTSDGFDWSVQSDELLLYRLPEVLEAKEKHHTIFFVEGEKDVDNLRRWHLTATHYPTKPDTWTERNLEALRGANVVVIPDNDEPGYKWAHTVLRLLYPIAYTLRFLELSDLPPKGDVSDWQEMGHSKKELLELAHNAPLWLPEWEAAHAEEIQVGENIYLFGKSCTLTFPKDGQEVTLPVARNLWPRELYHQVEEDEYGVSFLYRTRSGKVKRGFMAAGASISEHVGAKACARAASHGVQVATKSKDRLALALGYWMQARPRKEICLVRTPGWHGDSYVNGTNIFGAHNWRADEQRMIIQNRSGRKGTLEEWKAGAQELVTTRGLLVALGMSLAGALVAPLGVTPFGMHLCGNSSHGKSTASFLGAAVWGDVMHMVQSWDNTARSFEGVAEAANGACLGMDEIDRFQGDEDALSRTIHAVCSEIGRNRLQKTGDLAPRRHWHNTVISNGEIRLKDILGNKMKGGHRVRLPDVWCENGDLTLDEDHAKALKRFYRSQFGHVSDAWIAYLVQPEVRVKLEPCVEKWSALAREHLPDFVRTNEDKRIAYNFAIVCTALEHAAHAKLLSLSADDIWNIYRWVLGAIQEASEGQGAPMGPNERAYEMFMQWVLTDPYRFPKENDLRQARDVVAYRVYANEMDEEFELYTTRSMLNKSGIARKAAINVTKWIQWMEAKQLAYRAPRGKTVAGQRQRWMVIKPMECDECDD